MSYVAATRQAVLIACAAVGMATFAAAQTTYTLKVSAVGVSVDDGTSYRGTAQVTSDPAGIDCRAELLGDLAPSGVCTTSFPAGTVVNLTAAPLFGGTFNGWTGACAGQELTCHVVMTMDREVATRTIAKTYTLTVRGTGNTFGQVRSVDLFARPSIACSIRGDQTSGTCVTEFPAGQMVWLGREEPVNSIARFIGWTGCGPLSDNSSCRMVMDGPKTVTAGWLAMQVTIGSGGGNGTGTVSGAKNKAGAGAFDCTISKAGASGACSEIWETEPPPRTITLSATPTGNSVFVGWSVGCLDGPCQLPPSNVPNEIVVPFQWNRLEIRAIFDVPTSLVSVFAAGSGSGGVTSNPERLDCVIAGGVPGSDCATLFPRGTATLTADPTGGSTFGGWTGACSGPQPTCALVIDADTHVTARFNAPRPAAELALALLGRLSLSPDEQRQLDRFGNADGTFNLGDLLALIARTGERLSPATTSALMQSQASGAIRRSDGRSQ